MKVVIKITYRDYLNHHKTLYFSGWEETSKRVSPEYGQGVSHPVTAWLAGAKVLGLEEAKGVANELAKQFKPPEYLGVNIMEVKVKNAKKAGWKG